MRNSIRDRTGGSLSALKDFPKEESGIGSICGDKNRSN